MIANLLYKHLPNLSDFSALMEKLDKRAARAEKSSDKHFKSNPRKLGDVALSSPPKGGPKWAVDASFLNSNSSSSDVESGSGIDRMYSFQVTTRGFLNLSLSLVTLNPSIVTE